MVGSSKIRTMTLEEAAINDDPTRFGILYQRAR